MIWRSWSDTVSAFAEEIRAQVQEFVENHLASDLPAHVTRFDNPEIPGQWTYLLEQDGEAIVLIDICMDHVLEEAAKIKASPGMFLEAIRRSARAFFFDPHIAAPLRAALARSS